MAKIRFKCGCGKVLAVDEQHAGKVAKCPNCKRPVQVPELQNAPAPDEIPLSLAGKVSLDDAYGKALLARARRARVDAALREYRQKARKKYLIIAASLAAALLLGFIAYKVFVRIGPRVNPHDFPEVVREFLPGVNRSDPLERAAATWEIADLGGSGVMELVAKMARQPEPLIRLVAARALGRLDKLSAPQYLTPLLEDRDLDVRMTAAFVLARCAEGGLSLQALAPNVAKAIERDDEWAAWFRKITQEQGPARDITTFLDTQRQSKKARTRALAAWMIAVTLGPDQMILPLLRDPEPDVVVSTIHALEPFLTAEAFERLRKEPNPEDALRQRLGLLNNIALRLRHEEPRVREAAALTLAVNGQDAAQHVFARALKNEDWFVRFAAAKGLARLSPKVARHVIRTTHGPDPKKGRRWIQRVKQRIEDRAREEQAQEEP